MLFLGKPMLGNKNGAAVLQQKLQNIVFVVNLLQFVATNPTLDFPLRRVLIGKWNWKCFFLCRIYHLFLGIYDFFVCLFCCKIASNCFKKYCGQIGRNEYCSFFPALCSKITAKSRDIERESYIEITAKSRDTWVLQRKYIFNSMSKLLRKYISISKRLRVTGQFPYLR